LAIWLIVGAQKYFPPLLKLRLKSIQKWQELFGQTYHCLDPLAFIDIVQVDFDFEVVTNHFFRRRRFIFIIPGQTMRNRENSISQVFPQKYIKLFLGFPLAIDYFSMSISTY